MTWSYPFEHLLYLQKHIDRDRRCYKTAALIEFNHRNNILVCVSFFCRQSKQRIAIKNILECVILTAIIERIGFCCLFDDSLKGRRKKLGVKLAA